MKLNLVKLTLNQLLVQGAHLGYGKKFLHRQVKPYLLGLKGEFTLFNLKFVHLQFRLALHVVIKSVSLRQKILIVNHSEYLGNLLPLLRIKRCFLVEGPWVGGFLTNFKRIKLYTNFTTKTQPQLSSLTILPSLVFFFNTTVDNWGFKECLNLNIPNAVVTGSSFPLINKTLYPLVANNQTAEILTFYSNIIGNAVKKGLIAEKSKVFNLTLKHGKTYTLL